MYDTSTNGAFAHQVIQTKPANTENAAVQYRPFDASGQ